MIRLSRGDGAGADPNARRWPFFIALLVIATVSAGTAWIRGERPRAAKRFVVPAELEVTDAHLEYTDPSDARLRGDGASFEPGPQRGSEYRGAGCCQRAEFIQHRRQAALEILKRHRPCEQQRQRDRAELHDIGARINPDQTSIVNRREQAELAP